MNQGRGFRSLIVRRSRTFESGQRIVSFSDDAEGACNNDIESENNQNNKPGTTRQTGEMDDRGEAAEGKREAEVRCKPVSIEVVYHVKWFR